ncbi:MAG: uracil-DNA glycosylase [Dyella sp.]|uniref:uracil-DNA glycosylase n=1 Tax=Dyella sp. TaxID=1869338 RepID=UPI003F802D9A
MSIRNRFIRALKDCRFPSVFNPYTDRCEAWDLHSAPKIRERNLIAFMEAVEGGVESIWFGRDLGYLGGRRTGLALTDEAHLTDVQDVFGASEIRMATSGPVISERTATTTWSVLRKLDRPPFLWNIFPFHPYAGGDHQTNRCHTRKERLACVHLLDLLMEWAPSSRLIAIGNDAARGLEEAGLECFLVRHPSYGGTADFLSGMSKIYGVEMAASPSSKQVDLF